MYLSRTIVRTASCTIFRLHEDSTILPGLVLDLIEPGRWQTTTQSHRSTQSNTYTRTSTHIHKNILSYSHTDTHTHIDSQTKNARACLSRLSTSLGCWARPPYGKLVDNFRHESDVTFLHDPFTSVPKIVFHINLKRHLLKQCMLCFFLARPSSVRSVTEVVYQLSVPYRSLYCVYVYVCVYVCVVMVCAFAYWYVCVYACVCVCMCMRTKPFLEPSRCRTKQPGRTWMRGARRRSASARSSRAPTGSDQSCANDRRV